MCAAPKPSTQHPTHADWTFHPITDISNRIIEYWSNVMCLHDVIVELIGESEFKTIWNLAYDELSQWKECSQLGHLFKQYRFVLSFVHSLGRWCVLLSDSRDSNYFLWVLYRCQVDILRNTVDPISVYVKNVSSFRSFHTTMQPT